ncbi:MAG: LarC family nickel insertion protein [Pseudomonadota bacterium]|nr:LarC family nickel insertion protein [Pseudomonadota bacterium]
MHLHLNPLGGLAGDMFCAALLDAFPELLPKVRETVASLAMSQPVRLELKDAGGSIGGKRFCVLPQGSGRGAHHHTGFGDIRGLLQEALLEPGVHRRALSIFTLLAEAEGRVHGIAPDQVEFHEVGSWDSIADILSAAALLEALAVRSASCAALPLGGGQVRTAHGALPVPSPATALLMEGLPVRDDGIEGERVTPTGAAILKSLDPVPVRPGEGVLRSSGMGFGTRKLPGIPNCVQILAIQDSPVGVADAASLKAEQDQVATLRFEVDDQTPEDFGLGLDHLRATEGVLSVTSFQGIGKGGRPTMSVEVLARPEYLSQARDACFRETTTIGLRWQQTARFILSRRERSLDVEGRTLGVKVVERPDGSTAKAESRDVASETGHRARERLRRIAEARTLEADDD